MNNSTSAWDLFKNNLASIIQNITTTQITLVIVLVVGFVVVKYIIDKDVEKKDKAALEKTSTLAKSLAKTSGLLLQEKRKFETVLNTLSDAILFIDFEGKVTWSNTAFQTLCPSKEMQVHVEQQMIPPATDLVDRLIEKGNTTWPVAMDSTTQSIQPFKKKGLVGPLFDEEGNHSSYYIVIQK